HRDEGTVTSSYIGKLDGDGRLVWTRTFAEIDRLFDLAVDGDDLLVLGAQDRYSYGPMIGRYDRNGQPIWEAISETLFLGIRNGFIRTVGDDGYVVVLTVFQEGSEEDTDVYVARYGPDNTRRWSRILDAAAPQVAEGVAVLDPDLDGRPEGGFVIGGSTIAATAGGYDFWLLALDEAGNYRWERQYGGVANEFAAGVVEAFGGVVIGGTTESFEGESPCGDNCPNLWMMKVDPDGDVVWERTYSSATIDRAGGVARAPGGGYTLVGETDSIQLQPDYWVLRVDEDGIVDPGCAPAIGRATNCEKRALEVTEVNNLGIGLYLDPLPTLPAVVGTRGTLELIETSQCTGFVTEDTFTLTVEVVGPGIVVGVSPSFECDTTCTFELPAGSMVEVMAVEDAGSTFQAWEGDYAGAPISMDGDRLIRAVFQSGSGCTGAPVTISDGVFSSDFWIQQNVDLTLGAEGFGYTMPTGGMPDTFWTMDMSLPAGATASVAWFYTATSYDPATQGAISALDFQESYRLLEPLPADHTLASGLALMQDGRVHLLRADLFPALPWNESWQASSMAGLTAGSFTMDAGVLPDFGAGGGPITFGIVRIATNASDFPGEVMHGLDNFAVVVHPICP
ncbi:MAG: hypothetical protein KDC38_17565, partial [Planctomycetes bacterium]|nr:hypothetical protein [Planctomycetota bacterium]